MNSCSYGKRYICCLYVLLDRLMHIYVDFLLGVCMVLVGDTLPSIKRTSGGSQSWWSKLYIIDVNRMVPMQSVGIYAMGYLSFYCSGPSTHLIIWIHTWILHALDVGMTIFHRILYMIFQFRSLLVGGVGEIFLVSLLVVGGDFWGLIHQIFFFFDWLHQQF